MAKQYLKPGMKISLHGGPATVGVTCSTADINIEWSGHETYSGDQGMAHIVLDGLTFNIYIGKDGRLIYDDEYGF